MFKHILVPTDGSELSTRAAMAAIELAKSLGGRVTAFASLPEYPVTPYSDVIIEPPDDFEAHANQAAQSHLAVIENAARTAGVPCEVRSSIDTAPHVGIVRTAEEAGCDVILMASHGRGALSQLLIGSETHRVLAHSKIPVIVYR